MTQPQNIQYRKDGSIDTAHYIAHGRYLRSKAAHKFMRPRPNRSRGTLFVVVAMLVFLPFFPV